MLLPSTSALNLRLIVFAFLVLAAMLTLQQQPAATSSDNNTSFSVAIAEPEPAADNSPDPLLSRAPPTPIYVAPRAMAANERQDTRAPHFSRRNIQSIRGSPIHTFL